MRALMHRIIVGVGGCSRGATAVEYGLILALITIGVIGAVRGVSGGSTSLWSRVQNESANAL